MIFLKKIQKKLIISICFALVVSFISLSPISSQIANPIGPDKVEASSVVGKSHTYYISKKNVKDLYKSMKRAEKVGGWSSILTGLIPGGQAAAIAMALSSSSVRKAEVEKAYHKNMRLKVTYTYGITMSSNKTTFKAVK